VLLGSADTTASSTSLSSAFDRLSLQAKAVYVLDVRDDTALYAKNSTVVMPLASVTKLLTALVVTASLPQNTIVTVSAHDLATDGDSGLTEGEQWDLPDLVSFMLITSSNDAATALRSAYEAKTGGSFVAAMNSQAKALGLTHSNFQNEHGLDIGEAPSNTGSAQDVATLMAAALRKIPDALDVTRYGSFTFTSRSGITHKVSNTNELANTIPWAVGAKTGFTDSAGGNLALSFDMTLGRPAVIVVLGSTREGRFSDMEKLVRTTLDVTGNPLIKESQ
jgi:D-alanyl-D-alanine endopeptidase (penicillin-binding protein 7)